MILNACQELKTSFEKDDCHNVEGVDVEGSFEVEGIE